VLTKKEIFSRTEQLATNDPEVQSVVRAEELRFWNQARTGEWLAWNPGKDREAPPHWEFGLRYLEAVVPAYIACCRRLVRHPTELEQYIDACVAELTERVIQQKILPHSVGAHWSSVSAMKRLEHAARNRLATPLADIRAEEWRAVQPPPIPGKRADRIAEPARPSPPVTATGPAPTPVEERRGAVAAYKLYFNRTVVQLCKRARVNRSDFYKWMKGQLNDKSEKSVRIEIELRSTADLRPAA